ncbi:MAG: type II toxin-antitoxin system VapC family toxin [Thermodesulfobacteriota bacterium]
MKLLVDSSAFAKRYIQEKGSEQVEGYLQKASELALCIILMPEILSGLNRRLRENILSTKDYKRLKVQLLEDVRDATVIQITPSVISHTVKLLENNMLRAMDVLHVACALEWNADLFLTSDKRQFIAAKKVGLFTEFIGQQSV